MTLWMLGCASSNSHISSTPLKMPDVASPLVAPLLLEFWQDVDSQRLILNGLLAEVTSLYIKISTYVETLGQQNCLVNAVRFYWDNVDQPAYARAKISELKLNINSMTRIIVLSPIYVSHLERENLSYMLHRCHTYWHQMSQIWTLDLPALPLMFSSCESPITCRL